MGQGPSKPRADLSKPWERITRHAGLHPLRLHDLRHSFASVGAGAGMGADVEAARARPARHNGPICAPRRRSAEASHKCDR